MAISLSPQVIESMGFRQIESGEVFVATFSSLHAFEIQGFTLEQGTIFTHDAQMQGHSYRIAVSTSVNSACHALLGDELVNDEPAWVKEHDCTPPYLLLLVGPTSEHGCKDGYVKIDDSGVTTIEAFVPATDELRSIEAKVVPAVLSALSCVFNNLSITVRLRFLSRDVFGWTVDDRILHDIWFKVRGLGYISKALSNQELETSIEHSTNLAERLNPKVSRFFHLALAEDDPLKRFLYFFLAVEIETHATFRSIDHGARLTSMIQTEARLEATSKDFFNRQREKWTALKERFVWCSLCEWTNLDDSDIRTFTELKKIRDDIAHGSIASPPESSIASVQYLAEKIHQRYM